MKPHCCCMCGSIHVTQRGRTGLFQVIDGVEVQLPAWECFDCGWSGPEGDFL